MVTARRLLARATFWALRANGQPRPVQRTVMRTPGPVRTLRRVMRAPVRVRRPAIRTMGTGSSNDDFFFSPLTSCCGAGCGSVNAGAAGAGSDVVPSTTVPVSGSGDGDAPGEGDGFG